MYTSLPNPNPNLKALLKGCTSAKQIREKLKGQSEEVHMAVADLQASAVRTLSDAIERTPSRGQMVTLGENATNTQLVQFRDVLRVVFDAPDLELDTINMQTYAKYPKLAEFRDHCCNFTLYLNQIMKCGNENCTVPGCGKLRIGKDRYDRLIKPLPLPMRKRDSDTGAMLGEWRSFEDRYGHEMPNEADRPSFGKTEACKENRLLDTKNKALFIEARIIGRARCLCGKYNIIFSAGNLLFALPKMPGLLSLNCTLAGAELTTAEYDALDRCLELHPYSCGSPIVPEGSELELRVAVMRNITCATPQHALNYTSVFQPTCSLCGEEGSTEHELFYNPELKATGKWGTVLPICEYCKGVGLPNPTLKRALKGTPNQRKRAATGAARAGSQREAPRKKKRLHEDKVRRPNLTERARSTRGSDRQFTRTVHRLPRNSTSQLADETSDEPDETEEEGEEDTSEEEAARDQGKLEVASSDSDDDKPLGDVFAQSEDEGELECFIVGVRRKGIIKEGGVLPIAQPDASVLSTTTDPLTVPAASAAPSNPTVPVVPTLPNPTMPLVSAAACANVPIHAGDVCIANPQATAREYLVFWEGNPPDECTYEPRGNLIFDANEMEILNKKLMVVYKGGLSQCKVQEVLSEATVKVAWVRPPKNESKEFVLHLIELSNDISEWSILGYDAV